MCEYIQIGVTALRDPATGAFLERVPMYVRAADAPAVTPPEGSYPDPIPMLAAQMREYMTALEGN